MNKLIGQSLSIPENWSTIEDFAEWYRDNGCPIRLPEDARIFETDSTLSMIVFRQGDFQAEMYMIRPNVEVPKHSHPMKQIILWVGGWMQAFWEGADSKKNGPLSTVHSGFISPRLDENKWHSFVTTEKGSLLFVLEKWDSNEQKSSATIAYSGEPLGPMHAETLRNVNAKK